MSSNIQADIALTQRVVNSEIEVYNKIRSSNSQDDQLKKAATEFESIFVAQTLQKLDNLVDKEGGIFENNGAYLKNFKSFMFQQLGRDIANNPLNSFGLAKQIYEQMKVCLPQQPQEVKEG